MKVVVLKEGLHHENKLQGPYLREINPICSSVTLIKAEKAGEVNLLVDTGYYGFEEEILKALEREDLKPEDIDFIINTHEHYDHCANNYLFKNARKIAGVLEWYPDGKVRVYKSVKDIEIMKGVEIIETPGHKDPHISVIVRSDKTYAIAGDTIAKEFFVAGFENAKKKIESALKLLEIADIIVPGHGPIIHKKDFEYVKNKIKELEKQLSQHIP